MRNIIGILNENIRLRHFKKTDVFELFKDIIKNDESVYFTTSEFRLYDIVNNLIVPISYIYKEKVPELFVSKDIKYKEHWCNFDIHFKSRICRVDLKDNSIYIRLYGEDEEEVNFSILNYNYIAYNHKFVERRR